MEALNSAALVLSEGVGSASAVDSFSRAQETLEAYQPQGMGEEARVEAVRLHQAYQEEKGEPPVSFEMALHAIGAQAAENRLSGDELLTQEGVSMAYFVAVAHRTPSAGNCNDMLRVIESNLSNWANSPAKTPLHYEQVEIWRTQRDAIWQKRSELLAQERRATQTRAEEPVRAARIESARASVAAALEETPTSGQESQDAVFPQPESQPPEDINRTLGETWLRLNRYVPGRQFSGFAGYKDLAPGQQQVLAARLKGLYGQAREYRGDIRTRTADLTAAFDELQRQYQSGELFAGSVVEHQEENGTPEPYRAEDTSMGEAPQERPMAEPVRVQVQIIPNDERGLSSAVAVPQAVERPELGREAVPASRDANTASRAYLRGMVSANAPAIRGILQTIAGENRRPFTEVAQAFNDQLNSGGELPGADGFMAGMQKAGLSPQSPLWRENTVATNPSQSQKLALQAHGQVATFVRTMLDNKL